MGKAADRESEFAETVGTVYDCVVDPALWPAALERMCRSFGAVHGKLAVLDCQTRTARLASQWGGDPYWTHLAETKYAATMPHLRVLHQFEIDQPVNIDVINRALGDEDFRDSEFYRDWCVPAGVRDVAAVTLVQDGRRFSTLSLNTPFSRPDVSAEELQYLSRLAPHVRRAVRVGDLFGHRALAPGDLEASLELLSVAVLITDEDATVLHANAAAREGLATAKPLACIKGKLRAASPEVQKALTTAIARAATGDVDIGPFGISIPLLEDSPRGSTLAHVLPLKRESLRHPTTRNAVAALFITSSLDAPQLPAETLAGLYGLTPTEGRVMLEIASGRNRQEAAAALAMAASTVKSHLERIFAKTGTSSQAELIMLVARLTPPLTASRPARSDS